MVDLRFVSKSALAPILIGLGVAVSLAIGNPLGAIFFAFGLLGVCVLQANLFTGKAGYWWKKSFALKLGAVLVINLIVGYIFGFFLSAALPNLVAAAISKVLTWNFSLSFFFQSILCGMVMYIAVELYRKDNTYGIFLGVPLFILAGFQHCIANIIVLGVARTFSWTIILCILGNLIGSILVNILQGSD